MKAELMVISWVYIFKSLTEKTLVSLKMPKNFMIVLFLKDNRTIWTTKMEQVLVIINKW